MKVNLILIAAALALSSTSVPALAKSDQSVRYDQWEQKLRTRVNALHVFPDDAKADAMGDVLVGFRIGADGRPADITIRRSSGEAAFDAAAVRLVSRLGRLGPVPADGNVQAIELKLSYGEAPTSLDRTRMARSDQDERLSNERRNRLLISGVTRVAEKR